MNPPQPVDLRCEYSVQPLGVDTRAPRFSWILTHPARGQTQRGYQIIVSPDRDEVASEVGTLWDSGRVESDASVGVTYAGAPLQSVSRYYWRVRWWDADGDASPYSEIAGFGTGFLDPGDVTAQWISRKDPATFRSGINLLYGGIDTESPQYHAIYMRSTFSVARAVRSARAYVSGLGYYELRLNGDKVGDHQLDPGETDFGRVGLYSSFDVTQALTAGENVLGMILGNGRHVAAFGYGKPKGILELHIEYADGSREVVSSDGGWKTAHGPILENGTYFGERYDARREMPGWDAAGFDESGWEPAEEVDGPPLRSRTMPPIRATHAVAPQTMHSPRPGAFIYDMGQNFSGWVRLHVSGPRGTEVRLRFAENLDADGGLNTATVRDVQATDTYILKGGGTETYEPRLTYHGFRYVEVTGFPGVPTLENVQGIFVHSDVEEVGRFHCSNDLLNAIHGNIRWGQLCNLMSIPLDCPQRAERMGWMGDAHLSAEAAFFNFHMFPFYEKYLDDIRLAQREDGSLSDVIPPFWALYPADPAWGTAYVTLAWYCYLFTGDTRILEAHFDGMKRYVNFLHDNAEDHVLKVFGRYGDWCAPGCIQPMKTPANLTSTWYYYHDTLLLARIASILGKQEAAADLSARADQIKSAFNREFRMGGRYATNDCGPLTFVFISQTSQALPLYLDMPPAEVRDETVELLRRAVVEQSDCHVDTGIVGTRYLFDVLTEHGMADIAYTVATQRSYPSWGYMVEEGATTLWERWEKLEGQGMNSHNHIMFGSIDAWYYRTIAGLAPAEPGWKRIRVKPHVLGELTHASATVTTVRGEARVSWRKNEVGLSLTVGIPVNASADIHVPVRDANCPIAEGGTVIWDGREATGGVEGLTVRGVADGYVHVDAGSGFYEFEVGG